jgi:guanosine-3',5'-bis(diphosphate) 3'-pyrophosphohydrolase
MKKGEQLNKMLVLTVNRFEGRYDKAGKPYILHCLAVMYKLNTDDEELCCMAIGHDLIEDTKTTYTELIELGFSDRVIDGIRRLTKLPGQTSEEYIAIIKKSIDAIRVKLCDLEHNSDIKRMKGLSENDFERLKKYQWMYAELKAALESHIH